MADGAENFDSLFEGMILIDTTSQLSPPSPRHQDYHHPPPAAAAAAAAQEEHEAQDQDPPSQNSLPPPPPLDENLFSDLTLVPSPTLPSPALPSRPSPSPSRRKKRSPSLRVGYARGRDPQPPSQIPTQIQPPTPKQPEIDAGPRPSDASASSVAYNDDDEETSSPDEIQASAHAPDDRDDLSLIPDRDRDPCTSMEEKLEEIRSRLSGRLSEVQAAAASLSAERKVAVKGKRRTAEDLASASAEFARLERELEQACEAEDFERAETVSQRLAAAEREKASFLEALREAELRCDQVESRLLEILNLQITAEEEGASMLLGFSADAAGSADSILKNAEDFSSVEMERWVSATENLEAKKMALDIESCLINQARSGLEDCIESSIEEDRKEKEVLCKKHDELTAELDHLLALVRLKESEIAENNSRIEEVEKRIVNVVSEFQSDQSSIDVKYNDLRSAFSQVESEAEALSAKKKEVDEYMIEIERKKLKLGELASSGASEAKACQEIVGSRKSLASSVLKSREKKVCLVKIEEKLSEDTQILRQQVSSAQAFLQELSSTRARIQQEIASFKQRIGFIDKRGPELEAEKRIAAAARNFKEAGRISLEGKALNVEKEDLQNKVDKAMLELEKVEKEISDTVNKLQESEDLISSKEKEAARAGCERLQLVAAAAMAERTAALKLGDLEEADFLLAEAEAARLEAMKLQQAFELKLEEIGKTTNHFISMALIANLTGKDLSEMAAFVLPDGV